MNLYANRYEIMGHLGRGSSGTVYRAKDVKSGLPCALKFFSLRTTTLKKVGLPSFQAEFAALMNLNHPSIAKIYDAGFNEEKKECYLASEFIEGDDLFRATEALELSETESLFVEALRAFNYLHQQKVYHLDVKPQNLMVVTDNRRAVLKVIDFGMANFYQNPVFKPLNMEAGRVIVGTPAYVAPEIIRGLGPDGRADLYSLGIAFYKAFTRRLPFLGQTQAELHKQHLETKPPAPSSINPQIPEYLEKILQKLLLKDPAERYSTAAAVIEDLNLLSEKSWPVETRQTLASYVPEKGGLVGRTREWSRFMEFYNDRIQSGKFEKSPYIVVCGEAGTGKTRFLEKIRETAQKQLVSTISWNEFLDPSYPEISSPRVVLGDNVSVVTNEDIQYMEHFFGSKQVLAVLTTAVPASGIREENIIRLENFSREETEEYLEKATGLPNVPEEIVETLFRQTEGNPLFLSEYVKTLFQKEIFRASYGNWPPKVLEDVGAEFSRMGAQEFVKKRLRERLKTANPDDNILKLLALAALLPESPDFSTLAGLSKKIFSGTSSSTSRMLEFLVNAGILETLPADSPACTPLYIFSNPLYHDVILSDESPELLQKYCDAIADYMEKNGRNPEIVLYFRGRGSGKTASSDLLKLAGLKKMRCLYDSAREDLLFLLKCKNLPEEARNEAVLELGQILIEQGKNAEALSWLAPLAKPSSKIRRTLAETRALECLGIIHKRCNEAEKASACFCEGLKSAKDLNLLWMKVVFKNRLALVDFDVGRTQKAEECFAETMEIWKNRLNDTEKLLAIRSDMDNVYYLKGEFGKAIAFLEELLKVLAKQPSHETYPIILYKLGRACLQENRVDKAEALLSRCLEILKERKTPFWLYVVYNELGNCCMKRESWEKALDCYRHAMAIYRWSPQGSGVFVVAYNMAHVFLRMKNMEESRKYFDFVVRNIRGRKEEDETLAGFYLFTALLGLSNVHRELSDFKKAGHCLEEANLLMEKKSYLAPHRQYFWQEKADLARCLGHAEESKNAVEEVLRLKNTPGFNTADYELWIKSPNLPS